MPVRIQRKRTKGWRAPAGAIYVGRGSRWGNPFMVDKDGAADECIRKYAESLLPYTHHGKRNSMQDFMISAANLDEMQRDLKGKDLMCWCPLDRPCHADWLLSIVN